MKKSNSLIFDAGLVKVRKTENRSGSFSVFFDIARDGRRIKEYQKGFTLTGEKQKDSELIDLLKRMAITRSREIVEQQSGLTNTTKSKADFIAYFAELTEKKGRKAWKNTLRHLRLFAKGKPIPINTIDVHFVRQWKDYLLSALPSPNSALAYYDTFKACLNHLVRSDVIVTNPCNKLHKSELISKVPSKVVYLESEEVLTLINTPIADGYETIKRAFLFSCFTGLRLSDVKSLQWKDIYDNALHKEQDKTEKPVSIPLNDYALQFLGEKPSKARMSSLCFEMFRSDSATTKHLKRWIEKAGISKAITWHKSRHTFGARLVAKGVDIYRIADYMGHTSTKHTQIYAHIGDKSRIEDIKKLDEL